MVCHSVSCVVASYTFYCINLVMYDITVFVRVEIFDDSAQHHHIVTTKDKYEVTLLHCVTASLQNHINFAVCLS
jgi:hypothetical protein